VVGNFTAASWGNTAFGKEMGVYLRGVERRGIQEAKNKLATEKLRGG